MKTYSNFMDSMRVSYPKIDLTPAERSYCRSVIDGDLMQINFDGDRREMLEYINAYMTSNNTKSRVRQ